MTFSLAAVHAFLDKHPDLEDMESMEFLLTCQERQLVLKKGKTSSKIAIGKGELSLDQMDPDQLANHSMMRDVYSYWETKREPKVQLMMEAYVNKCSNLSVL